MSALADMGRLFDDEDEERMIQLTKDLTAWINKYAPTFDDPEALLFEVTTSLVTEDMEETVISPVTPVETPEQPANESCNFTCFMYDCSCCRTIIIFK